MGMVLAFRSIFLERLFASYMVDAWDFFKACQPLWVWENLTLLSLTSRRLTLRNPDPSTINTMLLEAGQTALRMPKLQTMEIWSGVKRHACAFRYEVAADATTISWCGTWDLELSQDVVDAWTQVARKYSRHELSVLASRILDTQDITSHAAAIRDLKLHDVLHPVSWLQILRESERYFYH